MSRGELKGGLLNRKKGTILTSAWKDWAKGRGVGDLQEDDLEELDATVILSSSSLSLERRVSTRRK